MNAYIDKAGQEWHQGRGGWHFNDGSGGDWFVLDRDMQAIIQEEQGK